jgi:dihydrofolate synthase/folylpolyglutamate synthase
MKARRGGTNVAIVGMRARKDADAFIKALAPAAARLIAVPLSEDHVEPELIAHMARAAGAEGETAASLDAALHSVAQSPAPRAMICGSLLLAAEALAREGVRLASSTTGSD